MNVKLETITPDAEAQMIRIARVSSPSNQDNPEYANLIRYCLKHGHFSVFEHAHMTLEIETSLAIATQILRHRSFTFQQFSQRYSDSSLLGYEKITWRKRADVNRQSSSEEMPEEIASAFDREWQEILTQIDAFHDRLGRAGAANECRRFVKPQCTTTRLYITGNIRSWIHYLELRTQPDTQLEHRAVALAAQAIFVAQLPVIAEALGWTKVTA